MSAIDFNKILMLFESGRLEVVDLWGGSDRAFRRIFLPEGSVILLFQRQTVELLRYFELLKSLSEQSIPVPKIFGIDAARRVMALEDAGDMSLYLWVNSTSDFSPYFEAVDILARIHELTAVRGASTQPFEFVDLINESHYFTRHFLVRLCEFSPDVLDYIEDEFYGIATEVADSPRGFMHRDYQSQNILIARGKIVVIDFQSARDGFRVYDLVSLLEDPYVSIPERMKFLLIRAYLDSSALTKDEKQRIIEVYPYAALQRLMQATAAYSYLSLEKGKQWFLKFLPVAVERIRFWLDETGRFPGLARVIAESAERIKKFRL